jgi:phage FluMu gp28-like protein
MRALCRTVAAWESQFLCIVQDAGGKLIPVQKIVPCEIAREELALILSRNPHAPRFGGYDVARRQHASAWHEYAQIGTGLYLAARQTWHAADFDSQEAWISARMTDASQPRIARMGMDATGLGMQMAERMAKKFPGRVDQVNLESHRRTELCVMLSDRFERQRIFVYPDDQLRADLSGPVRGAAANGALRVIVPAFDSVNAETGETETSHCDEFMAAVLANGAADAGASSGDFEAVTVEGFNTDSRRIA